MDCRDRFLYFFFQRACSPAALASFEAEFVHDKRKAGGNRDGLDAHGSAEFSQQCRLFFRNNDRQNF